jgi:hypothetical protein
MGLGEAPEPAKDAGQAKKGKTMQQECMEKRFLLYSFHPGLAAEHCATRIFSLQTPL